MGKVVSSYYFVSPDRRHVAVAGAFPTEDAVREFLSAGVTGPGTIRRRDGDDVLPVITLDSNGTEIWHEHGE